MKCLLYSPCHLGACWEGPVLAAEAHQHIGSALNTRASPNGGSGANSHGGHVLAAVTFAPSSVGHHDRCDVLGRARGRDISEEDTLCGRIHETTAANAGRGLRSARDIGARHSEQCKLTRHPA